jgi:hypothetical protein
MLFVAYKYLFCDNSSIKGEEQSQTGAVFCILLKKFVIQNSCIIFRC